METTITVLYRVLKLLEWLIIMGNLLGKFRTSIHPLLSRWGSPPTTSGVRNKSGGLLFGSSVSWASVAPVTTRALA